MTYGTMEKIETVTLGSSQASIDFQNIPATYTDLVLKLSLRGDLASTITYGLIEFNNSIANLSGRLLAGEGSGTPYSGTYASNIWTIGTGSSATASTFSNVEVYIPNYTSSSNKSVSIDAVSENNATAASAYLYAGLWSNTAVINRITIHAADGSFAKNKNWVANTTATLYGITRVPAGAKATGGVIYDDSSYWYHVFTSSGTFTPSQSLSCDVLVVAGGGGGGDGGGGGGAGGLLYFSNQTVSASQTVTVGAGGAAATQGGSSIFGSLTTAVGGGRGGDANTNNAGSGGSGGGAGRSSVAGTLTGGAATSGQGNAGGTTTQGFTNHPSSGGGGAGAAGGNGNTNNQSGAGGNGVSTYSSIGLATNTGQNISGTVWYAGGGGGNGDAGSLQRGLGGNGGGGAGGGAQAGTPGTANTGGGGGGSHATTGATGGSGLVIVRYAK